MDDIIYSEERWDELYREYKDQWNRSSKYVQRMSGERRSGITGPLEKELFKIDFISERMDNPKMYGKKLAVAMAKNEVYPVSQKQAKELSKAYSRAYSDSAEEDPSMTLKFKVGSPEFKKEGGFFDLLKTARIEIEQELKAQGKPVNSKVINMKIGQRFFGSK